MYKDAPEAFTDFNTMHMYRNFEGVEKWAEDRQLPDTVPVDFLQPPEGEDIYEEIP